MRFIDTEFFETKLAVECNIIQLSKQAQTVADFCDRMNSYTSFILNNMGISVHGYLSTRNTVEVTIEKGNQVVNVSIGIPPGQLRDEWRATLTAQFKKTPVPTFVREDHFFQDPQDAVAAYDAAMKHIG